MFVPSLNPQYGNFSLRPVNKKTDRTTVREIFRHEFYGNNQHYYPDDGLWEIYDRMETEGIFGAYLVFHDEEPLFLIEVHPPIQMDLMNDYLFQPGAIGIYCFFNSLKNQLSHTAFKACIESLLEDPGTERILTTLSHVAKGDPKASVLAETGFQRLPDSSSRISIYSCTRKSFHGVLCTDTCL